MSASSIGYVFRDGFRNIRRNRVMSAASIATVTISLFLIGVVWLLILNVNNIITEVESGLEINAYLASDVTEEEGKTLTENIMGMPGVSEVTYIPKAEALLILEGRFSTESGKLSETIGDNNPLPDMIQIKATDPGYVIALAEKLSNTTGVEQVRYGEGTVEKLLTTANWIKRAGWIGLIAIAVAACFLIATSIRVTVFSRKDEIEIMRLVGATNGYIRWPFIVEGTVLGMIGAVFASVILLVGYRYLLNYVAESLPFVPLVSDFNSLVTVSGTIVAIGFVLGVIGSSISVIKYLRV